MNSGKRIVWPVFMVFALCCICAIGAVAGSLYFAVLFFDSMSFVFLVYSSFCGFIAYFAFYAVYLFLKGRLWLSSKKKATIRE